MNTDIPGYTKGTRAVAPSPVSLADFALMPTPLTRWTGCTPRG